MCERERVCVCVRERECECERERESEKGRAGQGFNVRRSSDENEMEFNIENVSMFFNCYSNRDFSVSFFSTISKFKFIKLLKQNQAF